MGWAPRKDFFKRERKNEAFLLSFMFACIFKAERKQKQSVGLLLLQFPSPTLEMMLPTQGAELASRPCKQPGAWQLIEGGWLRCVWPKNREQEGIKIQRPKKALRRLSRRRVQLGKMAARTGKIGEN
jgi:hypothetical protein